MTIDALTLTALLIGCACAVLAVFPPRRWRR